MEERILEGIIKGAKEMVPLAQTELKEKRKCICKIKKFPGIPENLYRSDWIRTSGLHLPKMAL